MICNDQPDTQWHCHWAIVCIHGTAKGLQWVCHKLDMGFALSLPSACYRISLSPHARQGTAMGLHDTAMAQHWLLRWTDMALPWTLVSLRGNALRLP